MRFIAAAVCVMSMGLAVCAEEPQVNGPQLSDEQIEQYLIACSRGYNRKLEHLRKQVNAITSNRIERLPSDKDARKIVLKKHKDAVDQLEDLRREILAETKLDNLPDPQMALPAAVGSLGYLPSSIGTVRKILNPPNLVQVKLKPPRTDRRSSSSSLTAIIDFGEPRQLADNQEIDVSDFYECRSVTEIAGQKYGVLSKADESPFKDWVADHKVEAKEKVAELKATR